MASIIVAGSRDLIILPVHIGIALMNFGLDVTEIVSGAAKGVDTAAARWAWKERIPLRTFPVHPVEWEKYGPSAGHRRNRRMGDHADALLAFWNGHSPGTKGMIEYMHELGKPVKVVLKA